MTQANVPITYSALCNTISYCAGQRMFDSQNASTRQAMADTIVNRLHKKFPRYFFYCEIVDDLEGTIIVTDPTKLKIFHFDFIVRI